MGLTDRAFALYEEMRRTAASEEEDDEAIAAPARANNHHILNTRVLVDSSRNRRAPDTATYNTLTPAACVASNQPHREGVTATWLPRACPVRAHLREPDDGGGSGATGRWSGRRRRRRREDFHRDGGRRLDRSATGSRTAAIIQRRRRGRSGAFKAFAAMKAAGCSPPSSLVVC